MSESKNIIYLALGSNLGDRVAKILKAHTHLESHPQIQVLKKSKIYETEPWPKHDIPEGRPLETQRQHWHLNQVLQVQTNLSAQEFLNEIQQIEKKIGKISKSEWGSREIDIDILLYGQEVVNLPDLKIPHPHMRDRQFVLIPLLEIEPELIDPVSKLSFLHFLNQIEIHHLVRPYIIL